MATESWLKKELERPLCKFRTRLMAEPKPNPETGIEALQDAAKEAGKEFQEYIKGPCQWLETGKVPNQINLETPEAQAAWGFAMLADATREPADQSWKAIVDINDRLLQERRMIGALLMGTIKNPRSTISWGKPGSWFYHDPKHHHINIDPATAMVMGLQNSRSICLHEIGHSDITHERSPKILELIKKIESMGKRTPDGKLEVDPEKTVELQKLNREYQMRENLWQYTEDAAVNTYAEIEGENYPNDVKLGFFRTYAVIQISRIQAEQNNPMKELQEIIGKLLKEAAGIPEPTPEQVEAEKLIKERLLAAGASYPISRGWMKTEDPEEWERLNTRLSPETKTIVDELAGEDGLAFIQPSLAAGRLDNLKGLAVTISKECGHQRNLKCDEIFDRFILPELEKLPPPPQLPRSVVFKPGDSDPTKAEKSEPSEGAPGGETIQGCLEEMEEAARKERENRQDTEKIQKEAIKNSMGQKSPMDKLPDNVGSYEDAVAQCAPQIQIVKGMLRAIQKNQEVPGKKNPALMPETGVQDFDIGVYQAYQEKIAGGERIHEDDYKFFKTPLTKKAPATTRLVFYIDGSGSMYGEKTKKTMLTLAIFQEAAKKAGGVTVTALYSGADKTELLLNGEPTDSQKKTIGAVLASGVARGDNEICASGLKEMLVALEKTSPPNTKIGNTHVIFLTDGGTASCQETEIVESIQAFLNIDPTYSFDTILVDGSTNNPFDKANEKIKPRREKQTPGLVTTADPNLIAKEALKFASHRFRQMKSFAPQLEESLSRKGRPAKKRLEEIDR